MDKKTFILAVLLIFVIIPSALAVYNTYAHSSFKVADGKDIDLNGQIIGNGNAKDLTCVSGCVGFGTQINADNIISGSLDPARIPNMNASNLTSGTVPASRLNLTYLNATLNLTYLNASNITAGTIPLARTQTNVKIGTFTYDTSTASGTQAITGVGFQPRLVYISGSVFANNNETFSGFSDGSNTYSVNNYNNLIGFKTLTESQIGLYQTVSIMVTGTITFQADGFTIAWTKTGSKTGSATIIYSAIR